MLMLVPWPEELCARASFQRPCAVLATPSSTSSSASGRAMPNALYYTAKLAAGARIGIGTQLWTLNCVPKREFCCAGRCF